jgi:hypothetical protein
VPTIQYVEHTFSARSLRTIEHANAIIAEYAGQGFVLTLRQLYYQFVARDLSPNTLRDYKRLGSLVNDARLAGLIDWDAIEDRTRNLARVSTWDSPEDIVAGAASSYRIDLWADQPVRVEVWIEKEALAGVFDRVCRELRVPFLSCRGYTSQSEMHVAALRLRRIHKAGQTPVILHFGDHDPSGIDMTRDIRERLAIFRCKLELRRLALNRDQVDQYDPPPNPAKETDSRYRGYIEEHGGESWELDALEPKVLAELVRSAVAPLLDREKWQAAVARESAERRQLEAVSERWADVVDLVGNE